MRIVRDPEEFFSCVCDRYEGVQHMIEEGSLPASLPRTENEVLQGKNVTSDTLAEKLEKYFFDLAGIRVVDTDMVPTGYGQFHVIMSGDIETPGGTAMWVKVTFSVLSEIDDGQGDTTYIWTWKVHVEADSYLHGG
jgi:hypothetical protein